MDPMLLVGGVFAVVAMAVLVFARRRQSRGSDGGGCGDAGTNSGSDGTCSGDGGGCDGGGGGD